MSTDAVTAALCLENLLAQENDALRRLDFPAVVALVAVKETALANLAKHPIVAPALAAFGQRLGRLAAENQSLLERAIAVQTRVVRIVARAATPPPAALRYGTAVERAPSHRAAAMALSTHV